MEEKITTVSEGHGLGFANTKPNYNIVFHRVNENGFATGDHVGALDFNGPALKFTGDAEESAKVFIDWLAYTFKGRLEEEYMRGYNDAKQGKEPQK